MEQTNRVFVYGTLRKGWGLNRYIQQCKGDLIGTVSLHGFRLFSLGPYPGINKGSDEDYVVGEVYEFPESTVGEAFEIMDAIELGAGYERIVVTVLGKDTYTYLHKADLRHLRELKDWTLEGK